MTGAEAASRWRSARQAARARLARLVPDVVTRLPFEVFVAVLGVVAGLPLLLGLAVPGSLAALLPMLWLHLYAVMVVLGAALTAVGVLRRHSATTASGLNLSALAWLVYGSALVFFGTWAAAWLAWSAFTLLALIAFLRATHYRRDVDIRVSTTKDARPCPGEEA